MALLQIIEMIRQCENEDQKKILMRLKTLNKEAYIIMHGAHKQWKQKYNELQKTKYWKEARELLYKYFRLEGNIICAFCGDRVGIKYWTLHHEDDFYDAVNIFTPLNSSIIHNGCHAKHHGYSKKR
jgi:hypothetical protein